jgi:hypothetical protein
MPRCMLAFVLSAGLAGCASHGATGTVPLGQPVIIAPGHEVALPAGARLRFVGVTGDSRCPPDVQCIQSGDATVAFEFRDAGSPPEGVSINTADRPPQARIGAWRLQLVDLGRGDAPKATVRVDPAR